MMPKSKNKPKQSSTIENTHYIAETAEGLEDITRREVMSKLPQAHITTKSKGEVRFTYAGPSHSLKTLATVIAVYRVVYFDVPRPKALLGHEHFTRLITELERIQHKENIQTWHLAAAGTHTPVMQRLIASITEHLSIPHDVSEGDLLIRLRPNKLSKTKDWEALIRITPRPLATRPWRVVNMPGALNASVAAALLHFTQQHNDDIFLNIGCGSGTMLIERAKLLPAKQLVGIDIAPEALLASQMNIDAAKLNSIKLIQADAQTLPLPDNHVTQIVADLPFGQHIGSHDENTWLYPALLQEASRVAAIGAMFTIVTHEVTLMEACLPLILQWQLRKETMITLSGLHPRIYVLERI